MAGGVALGSARPVCCSKPAEVPASVGRCPVAMALRDSPFAASDCARGSGLRDSLLTFRLASLCGGDERFYELVNYIFFPQIRDAAADRFWKTPSSDLGVNR